MGSEAVAFLEQPPGAVHATQRRLDHQKDSMAAVVLALDRRNELGRDDLPFIVGLTKRIMGQTPGRKRSISRWNWRSIEANA
jgi:hypothetical protein